MTDPLDPHDQPDVHPEPSVGVPEPPTYPEPPSFPEPPAAEPPPVAPEPQYAAPPSPPDPTLAQPGPSAPPPPSYPPQPGHYAPPPAPQHAAYAPQPAYYAPQPGYAPAGPQPVYVGAPVRPPVKHMPWFGAAIAIVGFVMFMLSVTVLSWVDVGGETFDMAEIADVADGVNSGFNEDLLYTEWYGEWLWIVSAVYVVLLATFSTLIVPASKSVRTVIWCLFLGPWGFPFGVGLGLLNLADERGTWAPRVLGALGVLGSVGAHVLAWINLVAWEEGGLTGGDMGPAVWVGALGLLVVAAGCAVGTRTVSTLREPAQPPVGWTAFPGA